MGTLRHFEFMGKDYVQVDELNALLKRMKKAAYDGIEPGWICDDQGERISAMLALNRLSVILNAGKRREERLAEQEEKAGSYMVYKPGENPREYWYFVEWRKGKPIIGQTDGMVFTYQGMADRVAKRLGIGWSVIDVSPEECYKTERLLKAIFADDEDMEEEK